MAGLKRKTKAKATATPPEALPPIESVAATPDAPDRRVDSPPIGIEIYNEVGELRTTVATDDEAEKYMRKHGHNGWKVKRVG